MRFSDAVQRLSMTNLSLIFSFLALLVGVAVTKIADYDFWWHLNLGRQVFEQMTPIVADRFSYTFAGAPQFNGEWLAELLIFLSYTLGGFGGVALLKLALLATTFYFLAQAIFVNEEDRASLVLVVVTLVVVLFALRFRLFVRPFLFSYLFVAIFLYVLHKYKYQASHRLLWALPVLQVFWANCSKGLFFGPLLVGLFAVAGAIERKPDKRIWGFS